MKVSCPFLHYPRYFLTAYLNDGRVINTRGSAAPVINIPTPEEDIITMTCESRDEAGNRGHSRMWRDGEWVCWRPKDLEELLAAKLEEEPVEEPEEEPVEEPEEEPVEEPEEEPVEEPEEEPVEEPTRLWEQEEEVWDEDDEDDDE